MSGYDDAVNKLGLGQAINTLPSNQTLGINGGVYLGKKRTPLNADVLATGRASKPAQGYREEDDVTTLQEAVNRPATWTQREMDDFIHQGVIRKVKNFSPDMGLDDVMSVWEDMVNMSASMQQSGLNITPTDILNSHQSREGQTVRRGNWEYDAVTNEPVKYVGPTSKTSTNTKFDLSTREDALALAKNSMAQMLGRMPTSQEVGNYLNLLNNYESANPMQSTTTSQISSETGEETSSSTTSSGGVTQAGRQAMLEQQMQQGKEYGAYQAATTYYGAMMEMLMRGY